MDMKPVRVRMAPSPTGFLHVGGLRTALYNYLLAKQTGGKFILRIEDTDRARFVEGALENIVQTLVDFNLAPDEGFAWEEGQVKEIGDYGPYLQSERLPLYKKHAEELIGKKTAYYCFCTTERLDEVRKSREAQKLPPKYDKHCLNLSEQEVQERLAKNEPHVVRLNVPTDRIIKFKDMVHGDISIGSNDIDDQVLLKTDGFPTYHLAVVVDDYHMKITHIIRGDEWIPSTPKHILLYEAFGWEVPQFIHLPLLLSKTKKKLSKRDGDVAVKDFVAQGYLPEALINFVAFLGWNPKTEQEVFTLDQLVKEFSVEKINKAGAVFDLEKLDWLNGLYVRQLDLSTLQKHVTPFMQAANLKIENFPDEFIQKILKLEQDRLKKFSEIGDRVRYFFEEPDYIPEIIIWKKSDREETVKSLQAVYSYVHELSSEKFQKEFLETEIKKFLAEQNIATGNALWPLRVCLSGLEASPSPFEIMDAFGVLPNGKDLVLARINKAIEKLS